MIPTATEFRIAEVNTARKSVVFQFRTPDPPLTVELPIGLLAQVMGGIQTVLQQYPSLDGLQPIREAFAIERVEFLVAGLSPAVSVQLQGGIQPVCALDPDELRRIARQIEQVLAHLDSPPVGAVQ